jgi:hypothetical protein
VKNCSKKSTLILTGKALLSLCRAKCFAGAQEALTSAKIAESCGYRQHDQSVNALKIGHMHESSQAQEKSKTS